MAVHVRCVRSTFVGFKAFFANFEFSLWGGPEQNTLNTKHLNCQPLRSFPVKPVANRLHHQQTHANVKRTGSFPDKAEEYAPDVSLQGVIPRRYALQFLLPSTAPCKSYRTRVQRMALSAG